MLVRIWRIKVECRQRAGDDVSGATVLRDPHRAASYKHDDTTVASIIRYVVRRTASPCAFTKTISSSSSGEWIISPQNFDSYSIFMSTETNTLRTTCCQARSLSTVSRSIE